MKITTESIIKMLPLEAELKKQLLDGWENFSSDQKYAITMTLWDAYSVIYQLTFDKNMREIFLAIRENKSAADKDLYSKVKQKTEQEMEQLGSEQPTSIDLSSTREELQKLLNQ